MHLLGRLWNDVRPQSCTSEFQAFRLPLWKEAPWKLGSKCSGSCKMDRRYTVIAAIRNKENSYIIVWYVTKRNMSSNPEDHVVTMGFDKNLPAARNKAYEKRTHGSLSVRVKVDFRLLNNKNFGTSMRSICVK